MISLQSCNDNAVVSPYYFFVREFGEFQKVVFFPWKTLIAFILFTLSAQSVGLARDCEHSGFLLQQLLEEANEKIIDPADAKKWRAKKSTKHSHEKLSHE